MEFCVKCGSILKPEVESTNKATLVCKKCGYKKGKVDKVEPKMLKVVNHTPKQLIAVIGEEEKQLRTLPTIKIECPNCDNNVAYVWQVQTRGSDESSTQFFRCTNCNYTFREYT